MPALATHYLCGNAAVKLMENYKPGSPLLIHRNAFNLGTQGPDIFFYYDAWPHIKANGIRRLGERMHEEKTGPLILEAIKYISESQEPVKGMLTSYVCGFLCHYILDCHTHPYIFYRIGFTRKGEQYTSKYTCYHRMFETALDVLMLKRELDKKPSQFKASEQIRIPMQAAAAIGEMYSKTLYNVYNISVSSKQVCAAIAATANISTLLRDKTGIKKQLLGSMEKRLGKLPMLSAMILPPEIKDGLDYLNSSHSLWYMPWDASAPSTASFTESFEAAAAESKKIMELTELVVKGAAEIESLAPLIGSRSYSTGKDCSLNLEFKYFDCIYE